jgi:glycosyltransferase involved in cell wall biosynthesis
VSPAGLEQALTAVNRTVVRRELLQRPLRMLARTAMRRHQVTPEAATVVIVNWNSYGYLETALEAIDRFSDSRVGVIVVDNHSAERRRPETGRHRRVRWIALPRNLGHGPALDLGFLLARTQYVVSLDVDAFPIAGGWIDRLVAPLEQGYAVAGVHLRGGIVHPCCLAMRLGDFVGRGHSFVPRWHAGAHVARDASDHEATAWDVGWRISLREEDRFLFERTGAYGPGDVGSWWKGLIYHNFYSTRFGSKVPPTQEEVDLGIVPSVAQAAWARAVRQYLQEA